MMVCTILSIVERRRLSCGSRPEAQSHRGAARGRHSSSRTLQPNGDRDAPLSPQGRAPTAEQPHCWPAAAAPSESALVGGDVHFKRWPAAWRWRAAGATCAAAHCADPPRREPGQRRRDRIRPHRRLADPADRAWAAAGGPGWAQAARRATIPLAPTRPKDSRKSKYSQCSRAGNEEG